MPVLRDGILEKSKVLLDKEAALPCLEKTLRFVDGAKGQVGKTVKWIA